MHPIDKTLQPADAARLDPAAVRKVERADRRRRLYAVVREVLQQCGFPADGYHFKVLALDADGWRYLVLIDLAPAVAGSQARPEPVQASIAQAALAQAGLQVDGVYWRPTEPAPAAPDDAPEPGDSSAQPG